VAPLLLYSARARDEFAFDDEFDVLRRDGRLDYHQTLTGTGIGDWAGRTGRIDATLLRSLWPQREACTLVCGPADFVAAVRDALVTIGVQPDRVVVER
jgi:ferredoxin-NADP reductase